MLASGTQIEGFRIDEVIGRGGMGVVYRATQLSLQRQVALKLLSSELSSEASFRERFRREARIQAALDHPNVVPVYDSGESPHGLYIAMQLIRGASLKRLIELEKLDVDLTLEILRGTAAGLDAAHRSGLIHRDVKPQNILVVGHHAYLADFGLTKAAGLDSITETAGWLGTLDYMAPEQIRGEGADARSDIYSLGAVLHECLTGTVPFPRATEVALIYAHLHTSPPSVHDADEDLPPALDSVIAQAMAKDPAKRPSTASEVIDAAATALNRSHVTVATPPRPRRPPRARTAAAETTADGGRALRARRPEATRVYAGTHDAAHAGAAAARPVPPTGPGRTERRLRRSGAGLIATVAVLGVAAAVAGFALGRTGRPAATPVRTLENAGVAVEVPAVWRSIAGTPVADLVSPPALAVGPTGRPTAGIVIGRTKGYGPDLFPAVFRRAVGLTSAGAPVRASAGVEGLLYTGLHSRANPGELISVLLAPTTSDDAVVACFRPPAPNGAAVQSACPAVMDSLSVDPFFSLEPRATYGQFLSSTLTRLLHGTNTSLRKYDATRDPAQQASDADAAAVDYDTASAAFTRIDRTNLSPQDVGVHWDLRDQLRRAAEAYRALAAALRAGDPVAWASARSDVKTAAEGVGSVVNALSNLGFRIA